MGFQYGQDLIDIIRGKKEKDYVRSYSQEGEDVVLAYCFKEKLTSGYKGFYVDIGACHPIRFSNTKYFSDLGWQGINVDATPHSMKIFNKLRSADINVEMGISNKNGELTYYIFNEPAVNCFDEKVAIERMQQGWKLLEKKTIKTCTLNALLDKYLPVDKKIDFIDIDVEGFEEQILKAFDFEKYAPSYFLIEALDFFNKDIIEYKNTEIYNILSSKGYYILAKTIRTIIWANSV